MRHVLVAVLCIATPVAMFASNKDNGYKITYDGGSLPDTKSGTGMKIYIEANQVRLAKDNADVVKIPATAITESATDKTSTAESALRSRSASSPLA